MTDKRRALRIGRRGVIRNARLLSYGVALLSTTLAVGIALLLKPSIGQTPISAFFVAVMVSAWYGGLRPGLVATILSALAINYFFIEPYYSLKIPDLGSVIHLSAFTIAALAIGGLNESRRNALHQEQRLRADSEVAQSKMQTAKERLETVLSSISDGFFVVDRDWHFTYVNNRYCEMAGMQREAILNRSIWELFPDTVDTNLYVQFQRALSEQTPVQFEYLYPAWNCWFEFRIYPSPDGLTTFTADISDRKSTEAALRESEARFKSFAENSNDVIWITEAREYRLIYVSPSYERVWGRSATDIYADLTRFIESIHPDDRQRIQTGWQQCAQSGFSQEYRVIRPDGAIAWIHDRGFPIYSDRGELLFLGGIAEDVTARKLAAAALSQSESRFRLIVESAKEYVIFTLDLNGNITSWNSGAERLLGYEEAEILGCKGRLTFTSEDNERGQAEEEMQIALTQGRAENERWHVRKDGSRFWGSGFVMPLHDEADNVQGFIKIMQDKTAQRQATERFHLLYDTTSDLLATDRPLALMHNLFSKLSAQLGLDYYYSYMVEENNNQSMLHLRNYEGLSDEAAGTIEWIEFGQHLCGLVAQQRQQIVLDQQQISTHINAQFTRSQRTTAYAGQPLIVRGRLLGTLAFASRSRTCFTPEEIDLLRSTCNQMAIALERANLIASIQRQAEQLQQANRIKDEFLAVLSHELRSPLNPILGWSKLLQTRKLDEAKVTEALSVIERNAKLQSELIEDLLDVSRILQGKLNLNVAPVNLAAIVQAAIETVRLAAEAKSISLEVNLDAEVGQVLGDATRLQQVVWNLLSNAVKFTPNGGRVAVTLSQESQGGVKRVEGDKGDKGDKGAEEQRSRGAEEQRRINTHHLPLTTHSRLPTSDFRLPTPDSRLPTPDSRLPTSDSRLPTPDSPTHAQIQVRDTGKGVDPDFLPYVFDYFRQADSATTRKFGGLGLGLAIVRHLVELHGGIIEANSPGIGLGATFTVRLPLMPVEAAVGEKGQSSALSLSLNGVRVLVVEDDRDTREFVTFLLEEAGATVNALDSASEGVAALTQFQPDVLLSDIGIPDLDGYMLLRQIRTLPPERGGQIPAIALTAYAGDLDRALALQAGFQQHIAKPVEPDELIGAIATLLQRGNERGERDNL